MVICEDVGLHDALWDLDVTFSIQQFLRCREAWLVGIIDDLDQSNPYEYLKRMAYYHRVHLFDVVMQYRAIFSDDTSGHEENTDGGLLYSWAMHRISSHLNVLRDVLPQITEGSNLAHILGECMVSFLKACTFCHLFCAPSEQEMKQART